MPCLSSSCRSFSRRKNTASAQAAASPSSTLGSQEGRRQLGHGIIGLGGVQVVSRQGRVEFRRSHDDAQSIQRMGLTFPVMAHPALSRQKIRRPVNFQRCQGADPLRPGNGQRPVRSQIHGSLRPRLRQGIYRGRALPGRFFRTFRCRFFQFRTPEAVAVNEPDEFQPGEQLESSRRL